MFDAIFWDMDGTLVDTERVVWEVMQAAFAQAAGIDLPEALFESLLGQSEADFYRAMIERFSLTGAKLAAIQQAFEHNYLPKLANVPALPGAVQKVREGAAIAPQALVTGSTTPQAQAVMTALAITPHFQQVVTCNDYRRGKPDPEPFLMAAERMGVDPSRCIAIEDSPSGVTAAKAAGVKVVGIHEGNQGKYRIDHADLELPSLLELDWNALQRLL